MPKKLDPEAKRAEHAALVRGLRRFAEQQGRPAVFPDLAGTTGLVMYGKYTEPGTLSHQVIEMVAAEINGCAHIRSASNPTSVWEPKPLESVRANYISKIGKEEGQEDAEAFEDFALSVQPAPEPDYSALSALPTQAGAAPMDTSEGQPAAAPSGSDPQPAPAVTPCEPSTPDGEESLLQAARWGHVDVVRRLLAEGVDPDTPQAYLMGAPDAWLPPTALMLACAQGFATCLAEHSELPPMPPCWKMPAGWLGPPQELLFRGCYCERDLAPQHAEWQRGAAELLEVLMNRRGPSSDDWSKRMSAFQEETSITWLRQKYGYNWDCPGGLERNEFYALRRSREEEARTAVSSVHIGPLTLLSPWRSARYAAAFGCGGNDPPRWVHTDEAYMNIDYAHMHLEFPTGVAPCTPGDPEPYLAIVQLLLERGARPDLHNCAAVDIAHQTSFDAAVKLLEAHTLVRPVLIARQEAADAAARAAVQASERAAAEARAAALAKAESEAAVAATLRAKVRAALQAEAVADAMANDDLWEEGDDQAYRAEVVASWGKVDAGGEFCFDRDEGGFPICRRSSCAQPRQRLDRLVSGWCITCHEGDVTNCVGCSLPMWAHEAFDDSKQPLTSTFEGVGPRHKICHDYWREHDPAGQAVAAALAV